MNANPTNENFTIQMIINTLKIDTQKIFKIQKFWYITCYLDLGLFILYVYQMHESLHGILRYYSHVFHHKNIWCQ